MRAGIFSFLLVMAPAVGSQEVEPAAGVVVTADAIIESCIDSASGEETGLSALEESCPGIEHALVESGYIGFIAQSEVDELTVYSLEDLQRISHNYRAPPTERSAQADLARLAPVLEEINEAQSREPEGWWQRFKNWLSGRLDRNLQNDDSWLSRALHDFSIPERVSRGIFYVAALLLIAVAIAVIVNELRAAGVFGSRARRKARESNVAASAWGSTLALPDLDRVPGEQQPSVLLQILVNTLVRTGRLRGDKSLTHRELGQRASFDAAEQSQTFRRIAAVSERLLYGSGGVGAQEIDDIVAAGRRLDQQLSTRQAGA